MPQPTEAASPFRVTVKAWPDGPTAPCRIPHMQVTSPALRGFAARLDLDARLLSFAPHRWHGSHEGPTLHLDDVSGIPFLVDVSGVEEYQHRARLRCDDDDLFATVTEPTRGYERYCREHLGLGAPTHIRSAPPTNPLAVAAGCRHPDILAQLVDSARGAGAFQVHPYMGIDDTWELAAAIATTADVPVSVLAPPPPVTWVANDKALFAELVELTLGPGWMPEAVTCRTPDDMARHLKELCRRHHAVGLKRTRCASAMGNKVFPSSTVQAATAEALVADVASFLRRTQWPEGEEVVVVAWEEALCSPSTQLWIEPDAPPRLDGIYEQVLRGPEQVFVGSRPSTLPTPVNRVLADAATRVATALQQLGYVGRCSFDHLVLGDPKGPFTVRFTECNGRWGGTSAPMHLVDRVVPGPRPPYRAQDIVHSQLVGVSFEKLVAGLGDQLYDRRTGSGRYLLYNVGPLERFGKCGVLALADTQTEADEALGCDLPRRLGID